MGVSIQSFSGDKRLVLSNAEAIRKPVYYSSWNRIRIGLLFTFDGSAGNIVSTPSMYVGVCSGASNVMAASSATHVVAMKLTHASWAYTAGPPSYFTLSSNVSQAYKKVGTTETTVNFGGVARYVPNTNPVAMIVEIIKGSPDYGIRLIMPSNSTAATTEVAEETLRRVMDTDPISAMASLLPGTYNSTNGTGNDIAVDEATDGTLDHIFVYWPRSSHKLTFNLWHRKIS